MIQFDKLDLQEVQELQNIISKNVEKSELERSYLYTHDTLEKAKIYIWCFRFLYSIRNLTKDGNLKNTLAIELEANTETYIRVSDLLHKVEKGHFNRHTNLNKLRKLILIEDKVDDMIDAFAVLLEKSSVLSMSRLKGFVLEGQSGKDYKKIFDAKSDDNKSGQEITQPELDIIEPENEEKEDDSDGFSMSKDKKIDEYTSETLETTEYFDRPKESDLDNVGYTGESVELERTTEEMENEVSDFINEERKEPSFDIRNHIGEGVIKGLEYNIDEEDEEDKEI